MNLLSINPYSISICEQIVKNKFDLKLEEKYGKWKHNDYRKTYKFDDVVHQRLTPRVSLITIVIPCASFYYLDYLCEKMPNEIVDIGCGMNFFKNILPNVVGIDASGTDYDIFDFFDDEFSLNHTANYEYAFSIDALHFIPITNFYNRVLEFKNIIRPGGRGYLAMNCARMVEHTKRSDLLNLFGNTNPSKEQLAKYIDSEIRRLPIDFLVVDNLILEVYDEFMDGNIRLVFES